MRPTLQCLKGHAGCPRKHGAGVLLGGRLSQLAKRRGVSFKDRRKSGGVSSHPASPTSWSCPPSRSPARRNATFQPGRSPTLRDQTYCRHGHLPPNQASRVQAQGAPLSSLGLAWGPSRAPALWPATPQDTRPVMERRTESVSCVHQYPHCHLCHHMAPTHHRPPSLSSLPIQSVVQQTIPRPDCAMTTQTFQTL